MLLDEPFSGLDAPVRARLYRDLRRLQAETGLATVLVTHDPEEAALLADEIIVLDEGKALQQGPIAEVLARPASPAVASLLGIPNAHPGRVLSSGSIASGTVELSAPTGDLPPGTAVSWAIRPEDIVLDRSGPYPAEVIDSVVLGSIVELTASLDGLELMVRTTRHDPPPPGSTCQLALPREAIMVWPADKLAL